MTGTAQSVQVGETVIPYQVRRSARAKRLRLVVRPGKVEVVVPRRVGDARVRAFVDAKRWWLYEKTEALRERSLVAVPPRFVSGAKVLFRGRFLRLRVEPAGLPRPRLRFATGFQVEVPADLSEAEREAAARRLVTDWLRRRAREDARFFLRRYVGELGVEPTRLRIGNQKTLWGSCSSRGVISLNWKLMAAPRPIYEYVVVHELCHLRERNHGPRFWSLVGSLLPDYRERRGWLKKHGVALG